MAVEIHGFEYLPHVPDGDLPIVLPYQGRWNLDRSRVKVCVKSRQVGITWTTALEAAETAAAPASDGGRDVWFQSYDEDIAKEFIPDVAQWAKVLGVACSDPIEEDAEQYADNAHYRLMANGKESVMATTVRFASGHRVTAMASVPRKIRGHRGVYIIDEADNHDDLEAALKAAGPFMVWGGRIMVISSAGDVDGVFNKLVQDIKGGIGPRAHYSLHEITFMEAVRDGLYRRFCEKNSLPWSREAEIEYVRGIFDESEDPATEYMCIPSRSGGQYLPRALVEPCTRLEHVVLRYHAEPGFLARSEAERNAAIDAWLVAEVAPVVAQLPRESPHYLGEDFGRSSDLTALAVGYLDQRMRLCCPLLLELGNVPYESQKRVLFWLAKRLPRLTRMVLDATGNGAYLAEQAVAHWGETVAEGVHMTERWWGETMPKVRARFQDGAIEIPRDRDVITDLGKFETVNGVPRLPKHRTTAKKPSEGGPKLKRHGDAGVALACLVAAASAPAMTFKYEPTGKRGGDFAFDGML